MKREQRASGEKLAFTRRPLSSGPASLAHDNARNYGVRSKGHGRAVAIIRRRFAVVDPVGRSSNALISASFIESRAVWPDQDLSLPLYVTFSMAACTLLCVSRKVPRERHRGKTDPRSQPMRMTQSDGSLPHSFRIRAKRLFARHTEKSIFFFVVHVSRCRVTDPVMTEGGYVSYLATPSSGGTIRSPSAWVSC